VHVFGSAVVSQSDVERAAAIMRSGGVTSAS
jgi:hypothetical protein